MKITTVCFLQPYFKHLGHFSDFLVIFSSCTTSVFVRIISGGCFDGCLSLCRSELRDRSCSGISSSSRTGLRLTDGGWDRWSRWSDSEWSAESWPLSVCLSAGEMVRMTVIRAGDGPLGFSVRGGSEHGLGVFISRVQKNSAAGQSLQGALNDNKRSRIILNNVFMKICFEIGSEWISETRAWQT